MVLLERVTILCLEMKLQNDVNYFEQARFLEIFDSLPVFIKYFSKLFQFLWKVSYITFIDSVFYFIRVRYNILHLFIALTNKIPLCKIILLSRTIYLQNFLHMH